VTRLDQLELYRSAGFRLHDDRTGSDMATEDDVADPHLHYIAATQLAARFLLSVQQERIVLMDRLAAIGSVGSEASVASFLLDIKERLEPIGLVQDNSFDLMVTQEQIGDVLGLTSVHVNRVLSSLTSRGLIERNGRRYRLPNADLLSATAARPERQPFPDQDWLPAAR